MGWLRRLLAPAEVASPTGTYTDVALPDRPEGYAELAWSITPRTDPSPDGYFWSHQFGLLGGEQGYAGLQTHNADLGGKIAIFSIWAAWGADGPEWAAPFGGEGTGWSARIRYDWQVGATYRLAVAATGPGRWTATVTDLTSGVTAEIGGIEVDPTWGLLADRSVMWSERYAGPLRTCADLRHAVCDFTDVVGTTVDGAALAAASLHDHLADPVTCPNSRITPVPGGSRHEMGAPAASGSATSGGAT